MFKKALLGMVAVLFVAPLGAKADSILPGTLEDSTGAPLTGRFTDNSVPESQSRPEFTVFNVPKGSRVETGYVILLDSSLDKSIPVAGPPAGKGVTGVPSAIELSRPQDWSEVAQFVRFTDASGVVHNVLYYSSNAENASKQDTGSVLDTIAANQGPSYPGLLAPGAVGASTNVLFLIERNPGNTHSGDKGAGESNMDNKYLSGNVSYNFHSDPPPGAANVVPEPASLIMFAIGAGGLIGYCWRRRTATPA